MKRKRGASLGFTLMEMLAVVVVLVILAAGMTTGLSTATRAYRKSLFVSDSEVLKSTLNTALGDILRYALYEQTGENGIVYFSNEHYQVSSGGHFVLSEGKLHIETGSGDRIRVINSGAYTGLVISTMTVAYDPYSQVYLGQYTITSQDGALTTQDCVFTYRTLR